MKAVSTGPGKSVGVLGFRRLPLPVPRAEDLLVKVRAAALNHADLYQRDGEWPPPADAPETLGVEIAGTVVEGDAAGRFVAGDAVMGLIAGGGYAEYALLDAGLAAPVPPGLSFAQAAALPEALIVGHHNLVALGGLRAGQTVLIHGGGSGMGSLALQMAAAIGARVATSVGDPSKTMSVRRLGAEIVFNRYDPDFGGAALRWTGGRGFDLIVDIAGAKTLAMNLELLAERGSLILMGVMSGCVTEIDIDPILLKRLTVRGTILRPIPLAEKRALAAAAYCRWLPAVAAGTILPVVAATHPFEAVRAAHTQLEAGQHVGKIILTLGGADAIRRRQTAPAAHAIASSN